MDEKDESKEPMQNKIGLGLVLGIGIGVAVLELQWGWRSARRGRINPGRKVMGMNNNSSL